MKHAAALPLISLFALAACGSPEPEQAPDDSAIQPAGEMTGAAPDAASTPPVPTVIPMEMQGRWGLVSADCEPGRADAKGLLEIGPQRLEFYESVGTLRDVTDGTPQQIRATFDFTGEGMNWERDMTLELEGASTLVRREFGDDAMPEPLRYSKCP